MPDRSALRGLLERPLTRLPGLYARLIARRRQPNLEKIVFLRLVRRGDTVLDIGANEGYYTRLFAALVGPRGSVHAFEPVPPTFARLQENAGRAGRVRLNNLALADEAKETDLYLPGDDHGQAALKPHTFGSWSAEPSVRTWRCRTTTLDAYTAERQLGALDFVKCDVEGAELLVLRGARQAIERFSPLLFLEVSRHWAADFAYEPADIARFLQELGYDRFFLVTDRLAPLSEIGRDLDVHRLPDSANLLCARGGRHERRLARLRPWLA